MSNEEEVVLTKTVAMPADTNPNGDIFGGWLLSQMDVAGGILAKNIAKGRVVTVAIEGMKFLLPVKVGDTVTCYGKVLKKGNSSISINLRVTAQGIEGLDPKDVTNGTFVYVAIDLNGHPRQLPIK
ncbi:MAG: acyl-CoA thioesterase [Pelagibacterales bacterium]|nr:acyl-CoA thioesterase [Pelagibacterales bacterium]OUU62938.1 MAG: acyl-CoA thioesterase [Alphaproteobacteria bacterium TMED62]|tara:strand:+ start:1887 stop:2264 length:378 start_codon:yes stop_codon:yes gene_type:complete